MIIIGLLLVSCESPVSRDQLTKYVDQDIRKLNGWTRPRVIAAIDQLIGSNRKTDDFYADPWYIWKYETDEGAIRYILFEGKPLLITPGQSGARIHIFNEQWQVISKTEFSTGWRIDITDASIKYEAIVDQNIIDIQTVPDINGAIIPHQILTVINDRIALLRIEDAEGHLIPNTYSYPNHTLGPPVPVRTAAAWGETLRSGSSPEILEALMWIAGDHLHPKMIDQMKIDGEEVYDEGMEEARVIEELRTNQEVREMISGLTQSNNPWIAETANLALDAEWSFFPVK